MKFDVPVKPWLGSAESAGEMRQADDAQDQSLMCDPGAGIREPAMAAGGDERQANC